MVLEVKVSLLKGTKKNNCCTQNAIRYEQKQKKDGRKHVGLL